MKIALITIVALVIAVLGVVAYQLTVFPSKSSPQTVCTMDAKLCPDGSYVGRIGPDCHFAKCPGDTGGQASSTGGGV